VVGRSGNQFSRVWRAAGNALLDLAVPRRCGLCGRFDTFLCPECAKELPPALPPRCAGCWSLLDGGRCRNCAGVLVPSLAGVRATYRLEDGARQLVHALKYDGLFALAEPMGQQMAHTFADWGIRPDLIVPVPLHPSRQRQRGFNQAERLAQACAREQRLVLDTRVLARTRRTRSQVQTSGADARRANVEGAFAVRAPVRGATVLLIDDVCTTGATLRECAEALRSAGAAHVYGLTFARED
jgi:competence protein ComFC